MYNENTQQCMVAGYNPSTFQRSKVCFGPGTQFSTYLEPVTWARSLTTQSWANTDGQYIAVDPTKCVAAAQCGWCRAMKGVCGTRPLSTGLT